MQIEIKREKKELRNHVLSLRESLSSEEVVQKSRSIMTRVKHLQPFISSRLVMCYIDFRNEVETKQFINECIQQGKRVAVPYIAVKDGNIRHMLACEIQDMVNDVQPGLFGILEPKPDKIKEVRPEEIDLAIIPGVVFDRNKQRIGYGAGFYDRFLSRVGCNCFKVGVAFDLQILSNIPVEEHDIPLDLIVTEYGEI